MKLRDIYPAPADFVSDGCTVPAPLKPVYRRYAKACRWHDWARRHLVHHGVVTVQQADAEFHAHLRALGMGRMLARLTWLAVKLARGRYAQTFAVPANWNKHINATNVRRMDTHV